MTWFYPSPNELLTLNKVLKRASPMAKAKEFAMNDKVIAVGIVQKKAFEKIGSGAEKTGEQILTTGENLAEAGSNLVGALSTVLENPVLLVGVGVVALVIITKM